MYLTRLELGWGDFNGKECHVIQMVDGGARHGWYKVSVSVRVRLKVTARVRVRVRVIVRATPMVSIKRHNCIRVQSCLTMVTSRQTLRCFLQVWLKNEDELRSLAKSGFDRWLATAIAD